jgi:hypothetical protein
MCCSRVILSIFPVGVGVGVGVGVNSGRYVVCTRPHLYHAPVIPVPVSVSVFISVSVPGGHHSTSSSHRRGQGLARPTHAGIFSGIEAHGHVLR